MIKLDERGHQCPLPVINTKKVIETAANGETIVVLTDNEIAAQNLSKLAAQKNCGFTYVKKENNLFESTLTVNNTNTAAPAVSAEPVYCDCGTSNTVVAVTSAVMGSGSDELGKVLMKGFIFALTQLDRLPSTIIFYNGGASISCEGSDSLEDLKNLEKDGIKIYTCGTCLNHYGLTEKLAVGEVTNMYNIAEMLNNADKIIRP